MYLTNRARAACCFALCLIPAACSSTGATDDAFAPTPTSVAMLDQTTDDVADTVEPVQAADTTTPIDDDSSTTMTAPIDPVVPGPAEAVLSAHRSEAIQLTEPPGPPPTTTTTTTVAPRVAAPAITQPPAPAPPPAPTSPPADPPPRAPPATDPPATDPPPADPPPTNPPSPAASNDAVAITNQRRAEAGLAPVASNDLLVQAAASHSADQAANSTMTHTGSNGSNAGQRIQALGYNWGTWGENVAAGYGSASSVMDGWMNSSGHRANILNPAFTEIGVASAASADGTLYWTMVLAAR